MSANPDSVTNQGQFHSSVPPAEPRTRSGITPTRPASRQRSPARVPRKDFSLRHRSGEGLAPCELHPRHSRPGHGYRRRPVHADRAA
ncbi:hypothetical protein SMAC4_13129 [Sordaria macrospora]|uniref:uncharacterized protein n=1 Tax=Sordaria macrospora TaxID=5147 RepID=UPI002B2CD3EF|nr:hypothetical protein SMAC4_13129 [Sordaria macrospora]